MTSDMFDIKYDICYPLSCNLVTYASSVFFLIYHNFTKTHLCIFKMPLFYMQAKYDIYI